MGHRIFQSDVLYIAYIGRGSMYRIQSVWYQLPLYTCIHADALMHKAALATSLYLMMTATNLRECTWRAILRSILSPQSLFPELETKMHWVTLWRHYTQELMSLGYFLVVQPLLLVLNETLPLNQSVIMADLMLARICLLQVHLMWM